VEMAAAKYHELAQSYLEEMDPTISGD